MQLKSAREVRANIAISLKGKKVTFGGKRGKKGSELYLEPCSLFTSTRRPTRCTPTWATTRVPRPHPTSSRLWSSPRYWSSDFNFYFAVFLLVAQPLFLPSSYCLQVENSSGETYRTLFRGDIWCWGGDAMGCIGLVEWPYRLGVKSVLRSRNYLFRLQLVLWLMKISASVTARSYLLTRLSTG